MTVGFLLLAGFSIATILFMVFAKHYLMPCDQCPLKKQYEELEEQGKFNLCTQNMLHNDYGKDI